MRKLTVEAMKVHAISEYPKECCGIVVAKDDKEEYWPRHNVAPEGAQNDYFELDPMAFVDAEEQGYNVVAIVHSHPNASARPSEADKVSCEAHGLPWVIVSVGKDCVTGEVYAHDVSEMVPSGYEAPLIGRPFFHGVLDCYALVRDFYRRELGVELMNFERQDGWWEDPNGPNLYLDNLARGGWTPIQGEPQRGDMILMAIRSKNGPNHSGVYLGDGTMLHHLHGRLSEKTIYGGYYLDTTALIVRHSSQQQNGSPK